MNTEDFYRTIKIDNLAVIQEEVLKKIPENLLNNTNLTYIENNKKIFLGIPELYNFLESIKINEFVGSIAINVTTAQSNGNCHVDSGPYKYSINIPILNCENTFIDFYKVTGDHQIVYVEKHGTRHHFFKYTEDQCELIYRGDTSVPYLLGTKTPHRVINDSDNIRIMLLIRMFVDPRTQLIKSGRA